MGLRLGKQKEEIICKLWTQTKTKSKQKNEMNKTNGSFIDNWLKVAKKSERSFHFVVFFSISPSQKGASPSKVFYSKFQTNQVKIEPNVSFRFLWFIF